MVAIVFNGNGTQMYTSGGTVSNTINYAINNGSTLQMASGSTAITGGGTFTLSSGATLGVTSTAGITSSGASGNIQVTGTRTYSTGAHYTYNGTSAQSTGNGLPSTVDNLTINHSAGVTLQANETVTNTLTLTSGNITTGTNTLTLGTSTSSLGTLSRTSGTIVGNFRRWFAAATVSNVLLPTGKRSELSSGKYQFHNSTVSRRYPDVNVYSIEPRYKWTTARRCGNKYCELRCRRFLDHHCWRWLDGWDILIGPDCGRLWWRV